MRGNNNLRDQIFGVLTETYSRDGRIGWWGPDSYTRDLARDVTTSILSHVLGVALMDAENEDGEYLRETLFRDVVNIIWNAWSGGTTAESTARKVFEVMGIEVVD